MTEIEKRLLMNQHEMMWALHYLLGKAAPDLVGRRGELDRMRDDILDAWRAGKALLDASGPESSPVHTREGE